MKRKLLPILSTTLLITSLSSLSAEESFEDNDESEFTEMISLDDELDDSLTVDATEDTQADTASNSTPKSKFSDNSYPGRNRENAVASGAPFPADGFNISFTGEYLYWTSGINDFYFASLGRDTSVLFRNLKDLDGSYTSGFRLGADYSFSAQGWSLGADWTDYSNYTQEILHYPYDEYGFTDVWTSTYATGATPDSDGGRVKGSWKLNFNQVDITLGKEIFFSKYFSLTPNMGGRFVWYNDKFVSHTYNINNSAFNKVRFSNQFHGFGFKLGFNTRFLVGYGLYIYGLFDSGLVYGPMTVKDKSNGSIVAVDNISGTYIKNVGHDAIPFIDSQINFGWRRSILSDKLGLDLMVGYEYHTFINGHVAYQLPQSGGIDITSKEDRNLYMHGMNITAKVSF